MSSRRRSDAGPSVPRHALVCGLGSIGRRHLRHLRRCGVVRIDAFRTGHATIPDGGTDGPDRVFGDLSAALAEQPDVVIVANPTALHVPVAMQAVRAGCHTLIEKPLSHTLEGCDALEAAARSAGVFVGVAYNLRFHPLVQRVRQMIQEGGPFGGPLLLRAHVGGYLPEWHPWEDYRQGYAARRDLGGGAALTNSHEIDEALWLLGPAEWSGGAALGHRPLGTDVDEAAVFCIGHRGGAVSAVSLSLVERPPSRTLQVDFEQGRAELDLLRGELRLLGADGEVESKAVPEGYSFDETYHEQLLAFFEALEARPSEVAGLQDGMAVLEVVSRMEVMDA